MQLQSPDSRVCSRKARANRMLAAAGLQVGARSATCSRTLVGQGGSRALSRGAAAPPLERPLWVVCDGLPLQTRA